MAITTDNETIGQVFDLDFFDPDTHDLVATAKVATETTISATAEEIKVSGGQFNKVYNKYYSTSELNFTVQDAAYKFEYLAMKTGEDITFGGDIFELEEVVINAGKGIITGNPSKMGEDCVAFVREKVQGSKWTKVVYDEETKEFNYVIADGQAVCVKYLQYDPNVRKIKIGDLLPKVYEVYGRTPILGGEKGKYLQLHVPKYQLSAGFELSLSPNGNATMDLSGTALQVEDYANCEETSTYYATLTEKRPDTKWYNECKAIYAMPHELELVPGEEFNIKVYADFKSSIYGNSDVIQPSELTYAISGDDSGIATVDANGKVTAVGDGTTKLEISVTDRPELAETVVITVATI